MWLEYPGFLPSLWIYINPVASSVYHNSEDSTAHDTWNVGFTSQVQIKHSDTCFFTEKKICK